MYSPRLVASAALLLVFSLTTSCSSWRQLRSDEQLADSGQVYDRLRVELVGGTKVVLRHARFSADTLRGEPELLTESLRRKLTKEGAAILPDKSIGVPIVLIRKMDERKFSASDTAGSGAAVALLLVGGAFLIFVFNPPEGLK